MPIYLDNNATTPLDPAVREAMLPFLSEQFGNPSSSNHAYGWQAKMAVEEARKKVAKLFNCKPQEVIWTSGATESNNLAILGVVCALRTADKSEKPHFITQATEHKAVLEVFERAQDFGAETTILPVNSEGRVELAELKKALRPQTRLISIMAANNEVGTVQPLKEIAELCRENKIIFHSDAAQAAGKCSLDFAQLAIDLLSLSGHKMYGPKGVGALIYRPINRDFKLKPLFAGGEQELGLRPGTLNVPAIVGLGKACEIFSENYQAECARLCKMRDQIISTVLQAAPFVKLNGSKGSERLCNNISLSIPGLVADDLADALTGIAFSSGSACNSSNPKPSHVLKAMGYPDALALSTIRLGIGRMTTESEVSTLIDKMLILLKEMRPSQAMGTVVN